MNLIVYLNKSKLKSLCSTRQLVMDFQWNEALYASCSAAKGKIINCDVNSKWAEKTDLLKLSGEESLS